MNYDEQVVLQAFDIYRHLARDGKASSEHFQIYQADDAIRALVEGFARMNDCELITAHDEIYLIPITQLSSFHVSNEYMRKTHLRSGATNGDLYLLYFTTLVLIGEFYDSYQTREATRQFISKVDWVLAVDKRIELLAEHGEEQLLQLEQEFSYNWNLIVEKWYDMDAIKESAKKQSGNTISRLSFIDMVKRFLEGEGLIEEVGNDEITITEKTKIIVQRYFFEMSYNRGILEFLYQFERIEEEESGASN